MVTNLVGKHGRTISTKCNSNLLLVPNTPPTTRRLVSRGEARTRQTSGLMADGHGEAAGLEYWLQWQVPVCALIFAAPTITAIVVLCRSKTPYLRAVDLWLPCWDGVHPLWLLGYRSVVFLAMLSILTNVFLRRGLLELYFYTQWTFALVTFYFALGTLISAHGCWRYSRKSSSTIDECDRFIQTDIVDGQLPISSSDTHITYNSTDSVEFNHHLDLDKNRQKAGLLGYLMHITYQICSGAALLTDIVFWGIIAPSETHGSYTVSLLAGCMHSVNIIFLLLDTSINSLTFPFFGLAYFIIWTCAYGLFQWILHACGVQWWPYAFMELGSPYAPIWYLAMSLVHIPCYGFYFLVVKAKCSFSSKLFPNTYLKSKYLRGV